MMRTKLKILLTTLAFWFAAQAAAQTTLQVATKHLEKEFEGINAIKIDAEKADIEIVVWNKSKVSLSIDLSAKHPDKSSAAHDINYLKIGTDAKNGQLVLRNYLLLGQKDKKPESNFKAKYVLKIPENIDLDLKNSFGKNYISGETKKLTINTEFCVNVINNVAGNIKIQTKYGDLNIDGIDGTTTIKTERSNLHLKNFSGNLNITSYYGEMLLASPKELQNLTLNADKSDIKLKAIPIRKYAINLSTSFGQIDVPNEIGDVKTIKNNREVLFNTSAKYYIKISNKSGNITLEKL
ncbi:hypothetical protein EGI22_20020 [Lacihabitans sp. LS3-19]|uniref:DUF4097 family beta strand repeat-containing protein n=1 Tax=Lacihabitans sp. LS3-19 TaxID=2487335 RepID=UPI0020CF2289|nr:DUF4097 family beta strand repeat-containing protein [Lacihabitans sp. LS3-19]MCP9770198.1 hypothetical protein [Lacihabitans sp. LS3-19]